MPLRTVPRIALDKVRSDSPADRRKAVATFGDALRQGACRILVPDDLGATPDVLADAGRDLLGLLEEYFGLEAESLVSLAVPGDANDPETGPQRLLSLHVVTDAPPLEIETADGWQEISARPGEWVTVPGSALETLTAGIVPAIAGRISGAGGAPAQALTVGPSADLRPLAGFEGTRA
jgi:hypothetical protein